jgi:hypothetical protein
MPSMRARFAEIAGARMFRTCCSVVLSVWMRLEPRIGRHYNVGLYPLYQMLDIRHEIRPSCVPVASRFNETRILRGSESVESFGIGMKRPHGWPTPESFADRNPHRVAGSAERLTDRRSGGSDLSAEWSFHHPARSGLAGRSASRRSPARAAAATFRALFVFRCRVRTSVQVASSGFAARATRYRRIESAVEYRGFRSATGRLAPRLR